MEKKWHTISCRLQFIDSTRFMASSLSNLVNITLLKEFKELNVKKGMIIKYVKYVELNIKIVSVFSNTQTLKII